MTVLRLWILCTWFSSAVYGGTASDPAIQSAGGPGEGMRELGVAVTTGTRGEILPCT